MYEFPFNIIDYANQALAILDYDIQLAKLRNKLVPLQ